MVSEVIVYYLNCVIRIENVMSPEDFASILCNDFRLNQSQFMPLIAEQIHQQIEDFFHFSTGVCEKQELFSKLVQLDQQMLTSFLQTVINTPDSNSVDWKALQSNYKLTHFERELLERLTAICQSNGHIISAATIPRLFEQPGELRCPIRIRVIVNDLQLLDAVEIDLLSTPFRSQQPEMVAHSICSDLGLGGEFITAVAHQIREQMWLYLKCLQVIGYPLDGSPILDEELGQHFMPPVVPEQEASNVTDKSSVIRPVDDREQWIPEYYTLSEAEMEKLEKAKERESRRKRRGARGKRAAAEQVDMFGFGLPGDSQQQSTTLSVTATGTGSATNDSDGEFGVLPVSTAPPKVFDRSAIILPDMSEPPKSRRSQLNVHLLPRLRQQAAAGGPTQPLLATTISIAPADQQLQHQSTGRKSGRKAAAQALQNISAIQKEETVLDNDEMQRQQFQFQQQQQVNAYWSNIQAMQMQKQQQLQQQQEFQRSQSPQFMSQMMSQQQQQQLQHNPEFLRQFQHRQVLLMQQRQQQQQQQQNRSNSPYQ